jgi:hypothetical protein
MDKQEPRFDSAADAEAKMESAPQSKTDSNTIDAEAAVSDRPSANDKLRSFPLAIYKPSTQFRRFALVAASVALAAALGGLVGSLSTYSFATPKTDPAEPARKLQAALTQVTKDVAALKTSIDASNRSATNQMAKISERFDRSEKALADPAAKIAALTETVSRIEKRLASTTTAAANDVTGSISAMAKKENKEQLQPAGIPGWTLREARQGRAVVENRDTLYEIMPGAELPGVGRVQTITQQNGHWVVTTQKGLIVSMP